jgi:hypothetical protein
VARPNPSLMEGNRRAAEAKRKHGNGGLPTLVMKAK